MTQIREALNQDLFLLFVAEGDSPSKVEKISHNGYLHKALRSLEGIGNDLFIFGHSFAANDKHILRVIEKGKVRRLFVSLYGDPNSESNQSIIRRANLMGDRRSKRNQLEVFFYDAESAHVWG